MKIYPHLIVCPCCESVYRYRLSDRQASLQCRRCATVLYRKSAFAWQDLLPFCFAALVTFLMANLLPVMTVTAHGLTRSVTLLQGILAITGSFPVLTGLLTAVLLIGVPLLQILLTGWVLLFAGFRRPAPGFVAAMKILARLHPWSMAEVIVSGFLVAAVKLSSFLDVSPGPGSWALVASVILLIIINGYDLQPLWSLLPARRRKVHTHHE
ncbi:paraquat-inducible protein A [Tatumella terrea]|uniref:paraquat-inducible protein A n=1 Tax=Tatumella terrea TaxID=419007 RepID=UPI0031D7A6EA